MEIKEIREKWMSNPAGKQEYARHFWDSVADYYEDRELPFWQSNDFLKLLANKVSFTSSLHSLDIGCGAGDYSMVIAPKVKMAVGTDLSPAMIEAAKKKSQEHRVKNAEFICADWSCLDLDALGWRKAFDLVFAHMTPAIDSAAMLEKMMACSKNHCFLTKPTRRQESVLDPIKKILGLGSGSPFDTHIAEAFELVWHLGACPEFFYWQDTWEFDHSLEEACAWYSAKIRTQHEIGAAEEKAIRTYLTSISIDGRIKEETKSTIVTMYWKQ